MRRYTLIALALAIIPIVPFWLACGGSSATCPKPANAQDVLITIEEHTEDGTCKLVPEVGVAEIDINSTLYLRMNEAAIKEKMATGESSFDPAKVAAATRRLQLLRKIAEVRTRETEALTALVAEIDKLDPPTLSQRVMAFGKLRGAFRDAVGEYAEFTDTEKSAYLRPRTGDDLIQEHLDEAIAATNEFNAEMSETTWRVEAELGKGMGSVQLHVDNYDELEVQSAKRFNKLAPPMPDEVAKQMDAATKLADQVDELRKDKNSLGKALLEQLKAQFKALLGDRFKEWEEKIEEVSEWTRNKDKMAAPIQPEIDRMEEAVQRIRDVGKSCQLLSGLVDGTIPVDETLLMRTGELYGCVDAVDEMLDKTPGELSVSLGQARQALAKAKDTTTEIPAAMDELVQSLTEAVKESDPWKKTTSFIKQQRKNIEKPAWESEKLKERGVDDLVDGRIELMRSPREVDDVIHLRASIVEDRAVSMVGVSRSMRVVSGGLRVDVGPALIFVQPFDKEPGDESFRTTPAVAATLHYRSWRESGETSGNRFWNFLDMGIGLHLAYLDLGVTEVDAMGEVTVRDPAAEIGVGGTVHIFGDLFQAGVGYDLQLEKSYWFLGIGIQRLTDFGISVPTDGG